MKQNLRTFCDVLVLEFKTGVQGNAGKCIESMKYVIWKYSFVTIDRFVWCMALRTYEKDDAKVGVFIIQLLLLQPEEFRNRVNKLVDTMSSEHHLLDNFHSSHLQFHYSFPETFSHSESGFDQQGPDNLPIYFGNVCLRIIPVFDIVVHRILELPFDEARSLITLLDHLRHIYKFHDKPITFLYNTLHYYERRLRQTPLLKKKLISSITGADILINLTSNRHD